jgi:type IV pilus assembly protein PilM
MALYNSMRYNEGDKEGCTLMVDIGARTTNLLFVENNRVFTRSIPIAGNAITQGIAAELGKSFQEAEQVKKEKGFVALGGAYEEPTDPEQAQVSKIIRHIMTRLHSEITRSINFYRTQQGGSAPSRALLSGGSSILPYTDRFFSEKLQIPVEYFNAFRNVSLDEKIARDDLAKCAHFFGEVVGLALRRMSECPIEVNLVPQTLRERKQAVQKRPYMIGAAISVLLVPLCLFGFAQRAATLKRNQLEDVNRIVGELERIQGAMGQKQEEINRFRVRADGICSLVQQRSWWPLFLNDINGRLISNVWLVSITPTETPSTNVTADATSPVGDAPPVARRPSPPPDSDGMTTSTAAATNNITLTHLRLTGAGNHIGEDDIKLVDEFKKQLLESPYFDKDGVEIEEYPPMTKNPVFTFKLRAKLAKPIKY